MNPLLFYLSIVLSFSVVSCGNATKEHVNKEAFLSFPDSLTKGVVVLEDGFLASEENLREANGQDLGTELTKRLMIADVGLLFPPGMVSVYDLETRFLPKVHLELLGIWAISNSFDSYILKGYLDNKDSEKSISVYYLLIIKNGLVTCSLDIASITNNPALCCGEDIETIQYCKRLSNNTFISYRCTPNDILVDQTKYRILDDGKIKVLEHWSARQ